jgi:hypothetical protein
MSNMIKEHSIIKQTIITCLTFLFIWTGFGNLVLAQEDLSVIFSSEAQDFLRKPICSKEYIRKNYMDFVGERIPPLILPSSKNIWEKRAKEIRKKVLSEVFFKNVPKTWIDNPLKVEWFDNIDKKDYIIRKLRYECLPSLSIPALLYVPKNLSGKVPVVLNVNGHVGQKGKSIEYKQIRCINEVKRGMIVLNIDWVGHGELSTPGYYDHNDLAYLDLCGVSGLSVFYLTLKKGLDLLLQQEHADPKRVAVTGLSGGGWQTIVISSLDTRVSCTIPVAGYIGILQRLAYNRDIGDLEQVPSDLCLYADYTHLTALLAPRPALLINNKFDDCCFKAYRTKPSIYSPIIPFYSLYNKEENFHFYENIEPGTHNYEKDNREQLYKFLNHEFLNDKNTIDKEILVKNEVLPEKETTVGVPENNQTFNSLALSLMSSLPLNRLPNGDKKEFLLWQKSSRDKLKEVIRFHPVTQIVKRSYLTLQVKNNQRKDVPQLSLTQIKYFINERGGYKDWEVPAIEITTKYSDPNKIAFIISGKGREDAIPEIKKYLASGHTVIALDILLTGEQIPNFSSPSFGPMLLANVGERALGISVSQLDAIAGLNKEKSVTFVGKGMVCSTIALLTASLKHSHNIETVELIGLPVSLKLLIENKIKYKKYAELYCFGLLRYFDIREYIGMASPTNIHISDIMGRKERVEQEFKQLKFQKWNNIELDLTE